MRTALPLLLILFLFYGCSPQLSYQNIVLVEHLERAALKEAQQDCETAPEECDLVDTLAREFADRLVDQAIQSGDVKCEEPFCDWPDTTDLIIVRDPETYEGRDPGTYEEPELNFFSCFDPPCDWPDPDERNSEEEFIIGFKRGPIQSYEFEIVDLQNNTIATSLPDNTNLKNDSTKEDLVQVRFQLLNPDFSGDAQIIIKRFGSNGAPLPPLSVRARVYNPDAR